ncbi:calcineurin B-like protein 4 [Diplogelasinospora grovesii]|uniref:Calcineurin B-like protein 4 n=1 Tax=Diplogelasinospora grovesii TaxID=303347 RepID=A0AAN6N9L0_9PEZI|nr:calcineurin B-like protein 4 [Diplogelasinospora grovesii]
MRSSSGLFLLGCLAGAAYAHGDHGEGHGQKPIVDANASWMTKHMAEEHHATDFDASSFFALHDFDGDGTWEPQEILRTYGLMDDSNKHVPQERRDEIVREIMRLIDTNGDGLVSRDEFTHFINVGGKTLPDMGTGPGHHGDDEYEYEIHHWEKYHDENTKLEDLTHPEDIEHFKKHEQMEAEQERLEKMERQMIIEENIPAKFRRQ